MKRETPPFPDPKPPETKRESKEKRGSKAPVYLALLFLLFLCLVVVFYLQRAVKTKVAQKTEDVGRLTGITAEKGEKPKGKKPGTLTASVAKEVKYEAPEGEKNESAEKETTLPPSTHILKAESGALVLEGKKEKSKTQKKAPTSYAKGRQFERLMGKAMEAVHKGQLKRAEALLMDAKRILPNYPALFELKDQIKAAKDACRLRRLLEKAQRAMDEEEWEKAASLFKKALLIEPGSVTARDGLKSALKLSKLMEELKRINRDPFLLGSLAFKKKIEKLIAASISNPDCGPKTRNLISRAKTTIDLFDTPKKVHLYSDGKTDVIIYRVGRLGRFRSRLIKLRPGVYTLLGRRPGFRDERAELKVSPFEANTTLTLSCRQRI